MAQRSAGLEQQSSIDIKNTNPTFYNMNFTSKPVTLHASQKKVYAFFADFNNFEKLMPDQVINWQSDKETCSFTIESMADIKLKYTAKNPYSGIKVEPDGKSPISFDLSVDLEVSPDNEQETVATITVNAALNPMLAMVAKRPLENLVDVMSEKLNGVFR